MLQVLGNFIKEDALAQVFSCEFCEISKITFFTEHLWTTAFVGKAVACQGGIFLIVAD